MDLSSASTSLRSLHPSLFLPAVDPSTSFPRQGVRPDLPLSNHFRMSGWGQAWKLDTLHLSGLGSLINFLPEDVSAYLTWTIVLLHSSVLCGAKQWGQKKKWNSNFPSGKENSLQL